MEHFNWTQLIPGVGHHYIHVATAAIVTSFIVILSIIARVALGSGDKAVKPSGKFSVRGLFEVVLEFIVGVVDMVIGHEGRKFIPMFSAIFVFVLFNNLAGLLPGMSAATDNLNTTLAIGLFSFAAFNYYGFKENGLGYIKHFMGPFGLISPMFLITLLIFAIEIVSTCVRPLSLGLRLMGNMTGDHTVLGIFLDMAPAWWVPLPVPFYLLGLFVCSLQAFVFTLLSMVYVSMAIAHDH